MNQYADFPMLEQLAGLRACIDAMTRNNDSHAALQQDQIEALHGALELSRRSLDSVHGEWRAVVDLLCETIELLRKSGEDGAADSLKELLRESLDRMGNGLRPTLN